MEKEIEEILEIYSRELDEEEIVHHIIEQIAKHPPKLAKLYENGEAEHFKEEVADVLLLAHALKKHTGVEKEEIDPAVKHFIETVDSIYEK